MTGPWSELAGKSALIIGAESQLSGYLSPLLAGSGMRVTLSSRRAEAVAGGALHIDLAALDSPLPQQTFDFVILCAGMTRLSACEANESLSQSINVDGSFQALNHFAERGSHVVFLSSNAVFSGDEAFCRRDDEPGPRTVYGRHKLAMEQRLLAQHPQRAAVLRATRMMHSERQLVDEWTRVVDGVPHIFAYENRYVSPVCFSDVAEAVRLVMARQAVGTYQIGGSQEWTNLGFAQGWLARVPDDARSAQGTSFDYSSLDACRHNSLQTHLPSMEPQYGDLMETRRVTMGLMTGHAYLSDPKRLAFTFSRYKFVAKLLAGSGRVLEVGCADAFASTVVLTEVQELVACDFDKVFIDDAIRNHPFADRMRFAVHDMVRGPFEGVFDAIYSLDVLEHIPPAAEQPFVTNIVQSLAPSGVCIMGMPSLESQAYASEISRQGHVNCKTGPQLKAFLQQYFENVFVFSMNDEVVHTGYFPMAQYLLALCCQPRANSPTLTDGDAEVMLP